MPAANEIPVAARALIEAIERYTAAVTATPVDQATVEPFELELEQAAAAYDDAVFDATGLVTPFVVLEGPRDEEDEEEGEELVVEDLEDEGLRGEVITLQTRYDFLVTDPDAVIALANGREITADPGETDEPAGDLPSAVLRLYRADNAWDAGAYDAHGLTPVEERVICGPLGGLEFAQELLFVDDDEEEEFSNGNGDGSTRKAP
jgi:hypothetical protein